MLLDAPPADGSLHAVDVRAYLGAQSVGDAVEHGDVVEYWKSAPYLFNFMDNYALKKAFRNAPEKDKMVRLVRQFPETFLDLVARAPINRLSLRTRVCANCFQKPLIAACGVCSGCRRLLAITPSKDRSPPRIAWHNEAAGLLRLAYGSARRRFPSFIRSGAPHYACGHTARSIDARRLEKAARPFTLRNIRRPPYRSAPAFARLSVSHIRPRLRPAHVGAKRAYDRGGSALAVHRPH